MFDIAVLQFVTNCARRDGFSRFNRRLQHGGVKAKNLLSVGGRCLGKQNNANIVSQALGDAGIGARAVALFLASDKDRASLFGESSNNRPTSDLGFGDEDTRKGSAEGQKSR